MEYAVDVRAIRTRAAFMGFIFLDYYIIVGVGCMMVIVSIVIE